MLLWLVACVPTFSAWCNPLAVCLHLFLWVLPPTLFHCLLLWLVAGVLCSFTLPGFNPLAACSRLFLGVLPLTLFCCSLLWLVAGVFCLFTLPGFNPSAMHPCVSFGVLSQLSSPIFESGGGVIPPSPPVQ